MKKKNKLCAPWSIQKDACFGLKVVSAPAEDGGRYIISQTNDCES